MRYLRILIVLASVSPAAAAQAQYTPHIVFGAQLGPSWTSGGEFRVNNGVAVELAGSVQLAINARTAVDITAARALLSYYGGVHADCLPSRHGGCRPVGADLGGWVFRAGVERNLIPLLSIAGSAGFGWYENDRRDVPSGSHGFPLSVQLIVPKFDHLEFAGTVQHTYFRDFGGESFSATAVLFGLRVR